MILSPRRVGRVGFLCLALGLTPLATHAGTVGTINATTTNTSSTTQHETDIRIDLPDLLIVGPGGTTVLTSQQFLKKIVNGADRNIIQWSLNKPLNDPKVQAALRAALSVMDGQKPAFPIGAVLTLRDRKISTSTSSTGSPVTFNRSSSVMVGNVSLGTNTTVTNTVTVGPGTVLFGADMSQYFFLPAGNTNIDTNTHSENFYENLFRATVTQSGGQTINQQTTETDTYILQRTFIIDLDAVYSNMFSGIPVALAQRESLVSAHSFIGDVNGRIFRAWLGPNEYVPPQGDGTVGDDTRIFVSGSVGWLSQNGGDTVAGLHDTRESANAGVEWKLNGHWNLGMAASYVHSDTDFSDDLGKQHVDGGALSVYGTWRGEHWYGDLLYSAGLFDDTTNRNTLLGGTAHGSANDWSHLVSLNLGYDIKLNESVVTGPYASLTYVHGRLDAYSEAGGGTAALSYGAQSFDSLVSSIGWQANWKIHQSWGSLTPLVHIGWERENLKDAGDVSAALLQSPFTLVGVGRFGGFGVQTSRESARYDALALGLGINAVVGERWTFTFDAEERTDFGPRNDFSIALRAEYRF